MERFIASLDFSQGILLGMFLGWIVIGLMLSMMHDSDMEHDKDAEEYKDE